MINKARSATAANENTIESTTVLSNCELGVELRIGIEQVIRIIQILQTMFNFIIQEYFNINIKKVLLLNYVIPSYFYLPNLRQNQYLCFTFEVRICIIKWGLIFIFTDKSYKFQYKHQQNSRPCAGSLMFDTFSYLYRTIKQEIVDQLVIFRQITQYYIDSIHQRMTFKKKISQINKKLKYARNYDQWKAIANEHDTLPQIQQALNTVYSPYYDYEYIQELKNELKKARTDGEINKLISILRSHSSRNIGNITSPLLYRDAYNATKKLIQEFQDEVVKCLRTIMAADLPNIKKLQFFGELRHSVGRSALLLSGGAIMGMYHIGVVQALMEANCMPTIITGSSAGSMIASFIATRKQQEFFDGNKMNFTAFAKKKKISLWKNFKRIAKSGYIMDINVLKQFLRDNLGDITFQQAFDNFGYILNITVTGTNQYDEDRLLNYLTAPNVMIWSAVAASCAIPFIFGATDLFCKGTDGQMKPYTLMNRKFLDGSIAHDLPMNKLSVFFNVNNFIVSQTNPWVIPFMDYTQQFRTTSNQFLIKLLIIFQKIKEFVLSEIRHRVDQISFVFPGAVTKFFNLATQSYVGNITIWPVPSLSNYLRILQNPTEFNMIMNFVQDGRFRTYPKISQIKSSLFYEKQITKCFKMVKKNSFIIPEAANNSNANESGKDISEFEQDDFFKKFAKNGDRIIEDTQQELQQIQKMKMKYRNQSFMIPRGDSFI